MGRAARRILVFAARFSLVALTLFCGFGLLESISAPFEDDTVPGISSRAASHLAQLEDRIAKVVIPDQQPEFAKTAELMALSQAATALLNLHFELARGREAAGVTSERLNVLADRLVELAGRPGLRFRGMGHAPPGRDGAGSDTRGFGIYFGHRLLVECARKLIKGDSSQDERLAQTSRALLRDSLRAANHFIVAPYAETDDSPVFPADQSAVLLALSVCERGGVTTVGQVGGSFREPLEKLLSSLEDGDVFRQYGLHASGWRSRDEGIPRGVGAAYEISNLAHLDPVRALSLYRKFRSSMSVSGFMFGGFREWPTGLSKDGDLDSGPVLFGIGFAASALALPAARLFQDREIYGRIQRTGAVAGGALELGGRRRYLLLQGIEATTQALGDESQARALILALEFFSDASLAASTTAAPWFDETIPRYE